MFIERLLLQNFRCFGPVLTTINLVNGLTAFVGANGSGKTAVMQALQRMFAVVADQRRIRRQDFHVPRGEAIPAVRREFAIEVILAFPELEGADADEGAVAEFFNQMAATDNGRLRCRLRLSATWTDDGSAEGIVDQNYQVIRTLGEFADADCSDVAATDRSRIQLIYVPASRDGVSQMSAFLRGRLWRAINWSANVRDVLADAGASLNEAFAEEPAVGVVSEALRARWQALHLSALDAEPVFRPVDLRLPEFIRNVAVTFRPDEAGRERTLDDFSDGQRSLLHLAMTAATLDVETSVAVDPVRAGFQPDGVQLPSLTLIAVEEPENNLAPFYLSRVVKQIGEIAGSGRAQALLSSHSASILSRIAPTGVRHFRLQEAVNVALVNEIVLPQGDEDASKFVREAVHIYPELYFARFVVLGEGASEETVLPRLADALGFNIDRSFCAVVPLGGRHVNHLWRLLKSLDIPYATLLDLDLGREGGGWGRIKTACTQLIANGVAANAIFAQVEPLGIDGNLAALGERQPTDRAGLDGYIRMLRGHNVYFCDPLDLDYSMLRAFPAAYQALEPGRRGPGAHGDPREAVFGEEGNPALYPLELDGLLRWYRYLFLGRGKPGTHVRVLSGQDDLVLSTNLPEELRALLMHIQSKLDPVRV